MYNSEEYGIELTTGANQSSGGGEIGAKRPSRYNPITAQLVNRLYTSPGVILESEVLDNNQSDDALTQVFSSDGFTHEIKIKWIDNNPKLLCWAAVAAEKGNPANGQCVGAYIPVGYEF